MFEIIRTDSVSSSKTLMPFFKNNSIMKYSPNYFFRRQKGSNVFRRREYSNEATMKKILTSYPTKHIPEKKIKIIVVRRLLLTVFLVSANIDTLPKVLSNLNSRQILEAGFRKLIILFLDSCLSTKLKKGYR